MLFLIPIFKRMHLIKLCFHRKEKDSFLVKSSMSKTSIITKLYGRLSPKHCQERASLRTSYTSKAQKKCRGSLTVEASLAVPIFFFALIAIIYLMEIMSLQMCVRIGMHSALDTIVNQTSTVSYMSASSMEDILVEAIGAEKMEQSFIVDGSNGLDCSGSNVSLTTGLITLQVIYKVEIPVPFFNVLGMTYSEEMVVKGWTGYESGVTVDSDAIYYITDTSSVYHVSATCTHLLLDISSADISQIEELRNEYDGKYTACSKCVEDGEALQGTVYIASSGSYYHSTLSCSGLTRTVYTVTSEDIIGMAVCSRCGL